MAWNGAFCCALLLLVSSGLARAAIDPALQSKVDQIAKDVTELKAVATTPWPTLLAALAAIGAATISAVVASRAARDVVQAQVLQARDTTAIVARLDAYRRLFRHFSEFPRIPKDLPSKANVDPLIKKLGEWYYGGGGGLVMSVLCKRVYDKAIRFARLVSGACQDPLNQDDYDALFYHFSMLRTACVYDVDARREPGDSENQGTKTDLERYLKFEVGQGRNAIEHFAAQQRANDPPQFDGTAADQ